MPERVKPPSPSFADGADRRLDSAAFGRAGHARGVGMGLLDGKVALVTGAARGNGADIARGLAEHGARVALVDLDAAGAQATAASIAAETGARALGLGGDVGDPDAARTMVAQTLDELDGLDVLVNNAGILDAAHFLRMTLEQWERTDSCESDRIDARQPGGSSRHARAGRRLDRAYQLRRGHQGVRGLGGPTARRRVVSTR